MTSRWLKTVRGAVPVEDVGLILPHEHLFTDLRGPRAVDYAQADPHTVIQVMRPFLAEASSAGVSALVECSTVGVGRNPRILRQLSACTSIHILMPTGLYQEAFTPADLALMDVGQLADLWVRELTVGVEDTGLRAGFIKLAISEGGPTDLEIRNLRAAAMASLKTGTCIVVHAVGRAGAFAVMDVLQAQGIDLRRFVWVHANLEPDHESHVQAARRGAYVSFDAVGAEWQPQDELLNCALDLLDAGHGDRVLLSHDAGWYDPSRPDGRPLEGGIRGFTDLILDFIPRLRAHRVSEDEIRMITERNPACVFGVAGGAELDP